MKPSLERIAQLIEDRHDVDELVDLLNLTVYDIVEAHTERVLEWLRDESDIELGAEVGADDSE